MKKFIFIFLVLATTYTVQAQKAILKTNPIGLAFGNFNGIYEHVLGESSSVLIKASYFYKLLGIDVNSFGIGGGYRYYITHNKVDVPTGFYIQPQIGYSSGGVDEYKYNTLRVGAELGYQWVKDSGFVWDIGIGPSYRSVSGDVDDIGFENDGGVFPTLTFAIGYAFD